MHISISFSAVYDPLCPHVATNNLRSSLVFPLCAEFMHVLYFCIQLMTHSLLFLIMAGIVWNDLYFHEKV